MRSRPISPTPRGTEYAELSRQVRQAGLLDRRPRYYIVKVALTAVALVAGWAAFVLVGDSWWQIAVAVFLAMVFGQLGFLGHDAGHRQIFATRKSNYILGVLCGNLAVGLSYGWWVSKHNRHHAHPNTEGEDPDVMIGVLAFSGGRARASSGLQRLAFRYQGYLLIPLLFFEAIALHTSSIRALTQRLRQRKSWGWEAGLLAVHVASYLAVVFLVLSPVKAVVFIVIQQGLFGFYLGCSFAPNHKGSGAQRRRPDRLPGPPGPHLTQRSRWLAHRLRPRRAQLPDRAPPVPVHAPPQLAPFPAADRRVLYRARPAVHRGLAVRLLRPGPASSAHRRPPRPPAPPQDHAGARPALRGSKRFRGPVPLST